LGRWHGAGTASLEEIKGRLRLKDVRTKHGRRRIKLAAYALGALHEHRKARLAQGLVGRPVFCDSDGGLLRMSNFKHGVRCALSGFFARVRARAR